jgi:2-polyprenyl-6-methoxyphenol hydroxylase-like FAD-dependent oxidoreductase
VNASPRPVVIVGAGPAGAALALLLVSRGIAATLVERQRDFEREFRGEAMMPSGLAVLDALGVDLARDGIPHSRPSELEIYVEGRRVLRLDPTAPLFAGRSPLMVSQPALLEHLVELASRWPGFRFLRGAAARELVFEGGRISGVRVETPEGGETLDASLVVGADGRASLVRRRGGFTARERGTPMDVVWTKLPWPASWSQACARAFVRGGHLLIAFPAPDGLLQVAWVILKGGYGALKSRGVEDWVREMASHASGDLAPHLRANAEKLMRPFLLDAVTDRVVGWARPGALLIGDAAHTMSPVGGQGLNVALRDAVVAANHLVPALRAGARGGALDAAAAEVEKERGPEIDRIQELAALPPRVVLARGLLPRLVRAALPWLAKLPPVRAQAQRTGTLFLHGASELRLLV